MTADSEPDTYPNPPHGWTCYHCGETFTLPGLAASHFGADPSKAPGCFLKVAKGEERGLLWQLRELERELDEALRTISRLRGGDVA